LLKKNGSRLLKKKFGFSRIHGDVRFEDSAHSELIQVADIVAYNVFRQFTDYGDEWEMHGLSALPTYEPFERLSTKFRKGAHGRIQGYGVVKVPLRNRIP